MLLKNYIVHKDNPRLQEAIYTLIEDRGNDLYDILRIIEHHFDTFPDDDKLDQFKIAARVLGRKARKFLNVSEAIKDRTLKTINQNVVNVEKSAIAK